VALFLRTALTQAGLALLCATFAAASPPQITPADPPPPSPRLRESVTSEGPLATGEEQYSVLYHYQTLSGSTARAATPPGSRSTLSKLEIIHPNGTAVYKESFPYTVSQGRFEENLTASTSVVRGNGGAALIVRFLDHAAASENGTPGLARQWWQVFAIVRKQEPALLGPPLQLGQGANITVNNAVAAVMTKGGIDVMPMASTAEVLALPMWTGNFYAQVPMRFDWAHGVWGEGQECFGNADGTLTERGCIMKLQAVAQPRSPDVDTVPVKLFPTPGGDPENPTDGPRNVLVTPSSRAEFLEMQGIVHWNPDGLHHQGVAFRFSDVWLRVRIDGQEGWVHGQDALDALGLPLSNPQ
jgi:hypothetical protein